MRSVVLSSPTQNYHSHDSPEAARFVPVSCWIKLRVWKHPFMKHKQESTLQSNAGAGAGDAPSHQGLGLTGSSPSRSAGGPLPSRGLSSVSSSKCFCQAVISATSHGESAAAKAGGSRHQDPASGKRGLGGKHKRTPSRKALAG